MKITMTNPRDPMDDSVVLDTGGSDVTLTEVFTGPIFETEDGAKLSVIMRDDGFEVHYWSDEFDAGWTQFMGGAVTLPVQA
jgi:hypothetical protein